MKFFKGITLAIGISLLIFMIFLVGPDDLMRSIRGLNPVFLGLAFLVQQLDVLADAARYKCLFNSVAKRISFLFIYRACMVSWVLRVILPIKVSDFALSIFLRIKGVSYVRSTSAISLDFMLSFLGLAGFATIGIFVYVGLLESLLFLSIACLIFSVSLFVLTRDRRILPHRFLYFKDVDTRIITRTIRTMLVRHKDAVFTNLSFNVLNWTLTHAVLFFLLIASGAEVDFFSVFLVNSITTIISLLPITPGSIGVKEASGSFLLSHFLGVPLIIAVNSMVVLRLLEIITALLYYASTHHMLEEKYRWLIRRKKQG